jgi:hypothetical protein
VKFRRNKSEQVDAAPTTDETAATPGTPAAQDSAPQTGQRAAGPWDSSEVDLEGDDPNRVDLGGLVVRGRPGLELRLQVDEASQQIAAVLLVGKDGAVEMRPFAAPRNGDIWAGVRREIAAETARRGGTASEAEGPYGTELQVAMPATTPDGQSATQPSRVLGISGPRWLLRVTFLGRPAVEPNPEGDLETALADVIVVRGSAPMPPGEPLPLVMPANARPAPGQQA